MSLALIDYNSIILHADAIWNSRLPFIDELSPLFRETIFPYYEKIENGNELLYDRYIDAYSKAYRTKPKVLRDIEHDIASRGTIEGLEGEAARAVRSTILDISSNEGIKKNRSGQNQLPATLIFLWMFHPTIAREFYTIAIAELNGDISASMRDVIQAEIQHAAESEPQHSEVLESKTPIVRALAQASNNPWTVTLIGGLAIWALTLIIPPIIQTSASSSDTRLEKTPTIEVGKGKDILSSDFKDEKEPVTPPVEPPLNTKIDTSVRKEISKLGTSLDNDLKDLPPSLELRVFGDEDTFQFAKRELASLDLNVVRYTRRRTGKPNSLFPDQTVSMDQFKEVALRLIESGFEICEAFPKSINPAPNVIDLGASGEGGCLTGEAFTADEVRTADHFCKFSRPSVGPPDIQFYEIWDIHGERHQVEYDTKMNCFN